MRALEEAAWAASNALNEHALNAWVVGNTIEPLHIDFYTNVVIRCSGSGALCRAMVDQMCKAMVSLRWGCCDCKTIDEPVATVDDEFTEPTIQKQSTFISAN